MAKFFDAFKSKRIALLIPLGFASGLPLLLSGGTLSTWMRLEKVDLKTIGLFSAVTLPYNFKFLWAPLLDRFSLPWLGRRRDWMITTQLLLTVTLFVMGFLDPKATPWTLAAVACALAFLSASQDIVSDAYRTDVLPEHELGSGTATFVVGYRIALIAAGAGALMLTEYMTWKMIYWCMAGLMLVGVAATVFAPDAVYDRKPPGSLREAVVEPFVEFLGRERGLLVLLIVMFFKFGDSVAGHMVQPFLVDLGFSAPQIGAINKGFGLASTIVGALVGGGLVSRLGVKRALLLFGVLQASANVGYMALAFAGKNTVLLWVAVGIDQFFGGIGTAAFVAFLMALCNKRFSAFQYALLSSASTIVGKTLGVFSGILVKSVGWTQFFLLTIVMAAPGVVLIYFMPESVLVHSKSAASEAESETD